MSQADLSQNQRHTRLVWRLVLICGGMFIFALFILPPFYETFCKLTGLNGKITQAETASPIEENTPLSTARLTVQFLADTAPGMPWQFKPDQRSIQVVPGRQYSMSFFVTNPTDNDMIGQAIPSVSPAQVTQYLKKMECFCFSQQPLVAGESKAMGLTFQIDPEMPENIKTLTLAYKLYDVTKKF